MFRKERSMTPYIKASYLIRDPALSPPSRNRTPTLVIRTWVLLRGLERERFVSHRGQHNYWSDTLHTLSTSLSLSSRQSLHMCGLVAVLILYVRG